MGLIPECLPVTGRAAILARFRWGAACPCGQHRGTPVYTVHFGLHARTTMIRTEMIINSRVYANSSRATLSNIGAIPAQFRERKNEPRSQNRHQNSQVRTIHFAPYPQTGTTLGQPRRRQYKSSRMLAPKQRGWDNTNRAAIPRQAPRQPAVPNTSHGAKINTGICTARPQEPIGRRAAWHRAMGRAAEA